MEKQLLACAIAARTSFDLLLKYLDVKKYSRQFQVLWSLIEEYYKLDEGVAKVDLDVIATHIRETIRSEKQADALTEMLLSSANEEVSVANVQQVVLEAKKRELADQLAQQLVNSGSAPDQLVQEFVELNKLTNLEQLTQRGVEIVETSNVEDIIADEGDTKNKLIVYPRSLSDRLEGGVAGGDHLLVYARPESGKTALCLTIAAGFARQGAFGIYFGNEDRTRRMVVRGVSCLSGIPPREVYQNPARAAQVAKERGLDNILFVGLSPGTPSQIEEYVEKYKPKWIVVDQIRNLHIKAGSKVEQLEEAAKAMRNIAKKYNIVVVSVTQAGDSAEDKEVLTQGDVDFSNTGIPGAVDVMIGLGCTPSLYEKGQRCISLAKNKLGGDHSAFHVRFDGQLSRVTSIE